MSAKNQGDELKKLSSKTESQLHDIFVRSSLMSTEELNLLYNNAKDNAIGKEAQFLRDVERVNPSRAKYLIDLANKRLGTSFSGVEDFIDYAYKQLEHYHAIKTEEDLAREFERAKRFVFYDGIELPIVVEFDYQFYTKNSLFSKPTFYSYVNTQTVTKFGKGAYHIAFPSTQALLTDEEVSVAMKHEFGHIFMGHCTHKTTDKFVIAYRNQAMDISINLGMTEEEQALLVSLAQKIWNSPTAYPCLNLSNEKGKGGFGIEQMVSPADWKGTLGWIKIAYEEENGDGDNGPGDPGSGGGGEGGGEGESQPIDKEIKVGDYVYVRDTEPMVYGQVRDIDPVTGEIFVDEISQETWDNMIKG